MKAGHETQAIRVALATSAHRPWPLPAGRWAMYQRWERLLFAHWPFEPAALRALVPPQLELDRFDGQAWIAVTPFDLAALRARGLPRPPFGSRFPELNVRTYVQYGDRAGVFFFSLDAGSRLAVAVARAAYGLPYFHAAMSIEPSGDWIHYCCERDGRPARAGHAAFDGRYRPVGTPFHSAPGSLEHFLTERYRLYTVSRRGRVRYADIHHVPWSLRTAEARIARNTMADAAGIALPDRAPLLHYSERLDVLVWPPRTA